MTSLRVSTLPRETAKKLHQRFTLVEVSSYMREELLDIISFYHIDKVDGKLIAERAERFRGWLERAIKIASASSPEEISMVLMDLPADHGFLLPAFQEVLVKMGLQPLYVFDREDPWRMVIFP